MRSKLRAGTYATGTLLGIGAAVAAAVKAPAWVAVGCFLTLIWFCFFMAFYRG